MIAKFPWMLLVIAYLIGAEYLQLSMSGNIGYGFIVLTIIAFFLEMFKAGDAGVVSFFFDQLWAIVGIASASALLAYLFFVTGKEPTFYHWIGFTMIVADALLNSVNAYRTALRNIAVPN
jgi:uncharacterized membrane protein